MTHRNRTGEMPERAGKPTRGLEARGHPTGQRVLARICAIGVVLLLSLGASHGPAGLAQGDPVIAAAGDIACEPADLNYNNGTGTVLGCRMKATSDLLVGANLSAVLLLGDNQYEDGALVKFQKSYNPTWGRVKAITHPAAGNHEYASRGAAGYFAYFGPAAGDPTKGYYSYDIATWHVVALNSNCAQVEGCAMGTPQERWLRADLAAHPRRCTLAYWHHPRFSSGWHGDDPAYDAFWRDLYRTGADVVLVGHDHDYERFAPQDPNGVADPKRGIREFVVGTGGKSSYGFRGIQANSEVRNAGTFGILHMTLHPSSYEWKFISEPGKTFTDSGRASCH